MLTDMAIRSLKPTEKSRKVSDEKSLYLPVTPGGSRLWRFKYRFPRRSSESKERILSFGAYPETSLKEARYRRDEARRMLRDGVDPMAQRREAAAAAAPPCRTFEGVALEWWAARNEAERWDEDYAAQIKRQFERDVFPIIVTSGLSLEDRKAHPLLQRPVGQWPFDVLTPSDVLELCKNVEARGSLDTARDLRSRIGMVYKREVVLGRCAANPAENVVALLAKPRRRNHAALTYEGLPEFFGRFDVARMDPATSLGLEALMATWLRSTELRLARWQWLDWDARELRIPSSLMKNGDKGVGAHVVCRSLTTRSMCQKAARCHPTSGIDVPEPISDGAWLGALLSDGLSEYGDREWPACSGQHDGERGARHRAWRTGADKDVGVTVDRQLDHVNGTVSGRYNRAEYLEPHRILMQWWGEKIQEAQASTSSSNSPGTRPFSC